MDRQEFNSEESVSAGLAALGAQRPEAVVGDFPEPVLLRAGAGKR